MRYYILLKVETDVDLENVYQMEEFERLIKGYDSLIESRQLLTVEVLKVDGREGVDRDDLTG